MFGASKSGSAALPSDPDFEYVTLLLDGNGTNGGQNNTFLDSSTNNFTITRNGNTTQGSFSPYGSLWSAFLGTSGNYFTSGTNSALGFGTGDFTIEFFLFVNNWVDNQFLIDFRPSGNASAQRIYFYLTTSGSLIYGFSGSNKITSANSVVSLGTWTHIAITRASGSTKVFVNGSQVGSTYSGSEDLGSNERFVVGTFGDAPGNSNANGGTITGYISNLRILKGTAQYTGSYTVPIAPLTAITNTSVLTFQSNRYVDNSANAISITPSGTPSVQRFSPFEPSAPYSTSVIGGSGYFDGSGDYVSSPNVNLSTVDFCLECWCYATNTSGQVLFAKGASDANEDFRIQTLLGDNKLYIDWAGSSDFYEFSDAGYKPYSWNHVAVVRISGVIYAYVNGIRITGSKSLATITNNHTTWNIGGTSFNATAGYVCDARITTGSSVYSGSSFTVPTSPLSSISGTQLLLNFQNASIADLAMQNNLETAGNAQVSTSVKKFGTGSLAFDGTGDGLVIPSSPQFALGTGNYTLEFWTYYASASADYIFLDMRGSSGTGTAPVIYMTGSVLYAAYANTNIISGTTPAANTWHHIALCRSGSSTKLFVNGTQLGSTYSDTTNLLAYFTTIGYGSNTYYLNGYIDDVRITKGVARYTANFTVPASSHPTY